MVRVGLKAQKMPAFFDTDFAFEAFIICDNFAAQTRNAILSMNLDPTFLRV